MLTKTIENLKPQPILDCEGFSTPLTNLESFYRLKRAALVLSQGVDFYTQFQTENNALVTIDLSELKKAADRCIEILEAQP
jgi:hypothetical protein